VSRIPVSRKDRVRSEAKKRRIADQNLSTQALSPTDVNAIIAQYLIDNPVESGGSVGKIVSFVSARLPAGSSGDILTSPVLPTGQYFKLTHLLTAVSTKESGMTLTIDGIDIFSNVTLADSTPSTAATISTFGICRAFDGAISSSIRLLSEIYCTSFILTKVSGTTGNNIDYAYEVLETL